MRRVLVPLDGSPEAEAIVPDALRLAGAGGELILVREATLPIQERDFFMDSSTLAREDAEWYLHHEAERLRDAGVKVQTKSFVLMDAASAIDRAAETLRADIIAIATHGRSPVGRLLRGGVAWRALAHSPVPVLLRHVEHLGPKSDEPPRRRHVMVPLDGSAYAEKALPLAHELALEWDALVSLVRIVPRVPVVGAGYAPVPPARVVDEDGVEQAQAYLERLASSLRCEVRVKVAPGLIVDTLVDCADRLDITDIVLASHGRTGLPRVILGSIADELIHRLHIPIIVVPALAAGRLERETVDKETVTLAAL